MFMPGSQELWALGEGIGNREDIRYRKGAGQLGKIAKEANISLSLHAPYYISMSSVEEEKRLNSVNYILASARAINAMGGDRIVVHTGSCGKISRDKALELAKDTNGKFLIDNGRVFDEMSYSVNETTRTITFVSNGSTVNEKIIGDGLFANIRFVDHSNVTTQRENIVYENVEFCNWNENVLAKKSIIVR